MSSNQTELAGTLVDMGYRQLFQGLGAEDLEKIWDQPGAPEALAKLAADEQASDQARFLAAEILFYKDTQYPPETMHTALASVYAAALANNFTQMANPWGLPDSLDEVGQHVIALGEAAVPSLVPLLDNTTPAIYGGSKEATVGNSYQYRIKDLAAYLISQIMAIPYTVKTNPDERDPEIEKLKRQLSS